MLCVRVIDNIDANPDFSAKISISLAEDICELIRSNMAYENSDSSYSDAEMARLVENKKPDLIRKRLEQGVLVYLTDRAGSLAGCGMVENKGTHYEAKTLHIHQKFRGKGYARLICDLRENILREHKIRFLYTESLKFPNTIRFHQSRGFSLFDDGKERKYSVLMKKKLI